MKRVVLILFSILYSLSIHAGERESDLLNSSGRFKRGENNAITDVHGVKLGYLKLFSNEDNEGYVAAIIPHGGNIFQQKCPAALYIGNGSGQFAGATQINEFGSIETPVILINNNWVAAGIQGVIKYTLNQRGNEGATSVNAVVGGISASDANGREVTEKEVLQALSNAKEGAVAEGKSATSSRVLPAESGGYTVGVLVGRNGGGSCIAVVITDAPMDSRQLGRLAKRVSAGVVKRGETSSFYTCEYVLAVSVNKDNLIDSRTSYYFPTLLHDGALTPLFEAAMEATQEAVMEP